MLYFCRKSKMIEARDLRIGNWVIKVTGEDLDGNLMGDTVQLIEVVNSSPSFKASIDLTPEWLERFGFEKKIKEQNIDGVEYILRLDDSEGRDGSWFSSVGTLVEGEVVVLCLCRGNYFCNNVEHVHQLQNLYFALTGKELQLT